jgi:tRNA threonylcarbamoyladenosine biosynthesis protein TsaB
MLLLAADTSGKHGSIALARCETGTHCEVIEVVPLDGGTFSAQQDVGGFAVVTGPGSFTGLRIGLAVIKALAEVLAKPIAAVSLLEAIAVAGAAYGRVTAVLDAGRGDVYAGEYEVTSSGARLNGEKLLSRSELIESAADSIVLTNDKRLIEAGRSAGLQVKEIELPRSDVIARLGWKKILAGEIVSPGELDANYIRRSAEIFSKGSS